MSALYEVDDVSLDLAGPAAGLQRLLPGSGDIKIYFVAAPAFVLVNQPFPLTIRYLPVAASTYHISCHVVWSDHPASRTEVFSIFPPH